MFFQKNFIFLPWLLMLCGGEMWTLSPPPTSSPCAPSKAEGGGGGGGGGICEPSSSGES